MLNKNCRSFKSLMKFSFHFQKSINISFFFVDSIIELNDDVEELKDSLNKIDFCNNCENCRNCKFKEWKEYTDDEAAYS